MEERCMFNCSKDESLITSGVQRIKNIISASKRRGDTIHIDLERQIDSNPNLTVQCHKSCVSTYTSSHHISRMDAEQQNFLDDESNQPPCKRRSTMPSFIFKKHCLFCGDECVPCDPKHPDRWRVVYQCRTVQQSPSNTVKEAILRTCTERGDKQAEEVRIRVQSAVSDLHAADAQYHDDCQKRFMSRRNIDFIKRKKIDKSNTIDEPNFNNVIDFMNDNSRRMFSSVELYEVFVSTRNETLSPSSLSRRQLITKILEHYQDEILVLNIVGCANVLCFRDCLPKFIHLQKPDDEEESIVDIVCKKVMSEVLNVNKCKDYDMNQFTLARAISDTSPTLLSLMEKLVSNGKTSKPSLSLAQSIQYNITKQSNQTTLGLALKLHHRFGSKEVVSLLHDYGFTVTYDEVLRCRTSIAKLVGETDFTERDAMTKNTPICAWFDNYDLNIYTPNGTRETHAMAVEFMQRESEPSNDDEVRKVIIPRISKKVMKNLKLSDLIAVKMERYNGEKKPIPPNIVAREGLALKLVERKWKSITTAIASDVKWLVETITNDKAVIPTSEWSGYMTALARDECSPGMPTRYVFGPLIDQTPSHPDTVLTTMMYAEKFLELHEMKYLHLVADMQLYQVAIKIKWSDPERWHKLILRPGGMHLLMSFIGCVGTLMKGSGLEDIVKAAYRGVNNMLNGKSWPKAVRGLRMVVVALLKEYVSDGNLTPESIATKLEEARLKPTGRLWVDCLIIPVVLIHLFIRSEKEGDWLLHLHALKHMIKYFFAAGHWHYARYALWYLMEMNSSLPTDAAAMFLDGQHVCRHKKGSWNSVFSDQFGEQTYIRYGKAKGGLVGMTLSADQVAGWTLSYHMCHMISQSMEEMFSENDGPESHCFIKHKEEGSRRMQLDGNDRKKITEEIERHIHPLKSDSDRLVNVVNGHLAPDTVNVQNAVEIGELMAVKFQQKLPGGFYDPIKKSVITLEVLQKGVKLGDRTLYDMEKLYARMLVVSQQRHINLEDLLSFELAPFPFSLFDEFGEMRSGNKAALVPKLAVYMSEVFHPDVELVDGNAMLYHVQWRKSVTVEQFVKTYETSVKCSHEVYVIFDHYKTASIKSHERDRRCGGRAGQELKMTLNMLLPTRDVVMKNTGNKKELIRLLCSRSVQKDLHMLGEDTCLFDHEEADVNLVSYTLHLIRNDNKKAVQVRSDDTDVLVLLMYFYWKCKPSAQITMKKFDGTVIDVNASAEKLGDKCFQLLPLHAATGCDTVSYPYGKGKVAALNLLLKHDMDFLDSIGNASVKDDELVQTGQHLFSLLYGMKDPHSMNYIRHKLFTTKINTSSRLRSLPPTDDAFVQHIKRAHLQARIWKCAETKDPQEDITKYGWIVRDGKPCPSPGITTAGPREVMEVVACSCATEKPCAFQKCSCKSVYLSCTSFCKCFTDGKVCQNEYTVKEYESDIGNDVNECSSSDEDSDVEYE